MPLKKKLGTLWNFTKHLHQNPPEPHKVSAPEPSLRNLTKHLLCQNPPELHKVSAPEPSGTLEGTLRNPPEPSGTLRNPPEPSGTLRNPPEPSGTLRNLTTHLHLDPPKPHQVAAPETSGTSPGTCTKTL